MKNTADSLHQINRIMNEMDSLYHQVSLKLNLSDSATFILYTIYDNGGKCLLNYICNFGICKQTINSAIRKLEREGIIYLEQINGKSKIAKFTEKGNELVKNSIAKIFVTEEKAFSGWTKEEVNTFIKLSEKYLENFREEIKKI